jgi:hypothetical protein
MPTEQEDIEKRGTIKDVQAVGGMLVLEIEDAEGTHRVVGDNGPTVRALMGIFGSDIVRGHSVMVSRLVGQEIGYGVDDLGILAYVTK